MFDYHREFDGAALDRWLTHDPRDREYGPCIHCEEQYEDCLCGDDYEEYIPGDDPDRKRDEMIDREMEQG